MHIQLPTRPLSAAGGTLTLAPPEFCVILEAKSEKSPPYAVLTGALSGFTFETFGSS
jgi:hypothetical protein